MEEEYPIKDFIGFLNDAEDHWSNIRWKDFYEVETKRIRGKMPSLHQSLLYVNPVVCRNPFLKCYEIPSSWNEESIQLLRSRMLRKKHEPIHRVAVIPTLSPKHRMEFVLFDLENDILNLLSKNAMRLSDVLNKLEENDKSKEMRFLWITEIQILLNEGLIIPLYNNNNLK